jgi:cytochrome c oxidase subunit 1
MPFPVGANASTKALLLGAVQFLFIFNFLRSFLSGRRATENPWEVGTLEWTVSSPPPHHNFDEIPVVYHGPHEFNHPRTPSGKDWIGQWERLPGDPTPDERSARTQVLDLEAAPEHG